MKRRKHEGPQAMTMKFDRINRRAHVRAPLPVRAQCIVENRVYNVNVEDVSEGGVRLSDIGTLPVATGLKLFLPIRRASVGKQHLCVLEGHIAWRTPTEIGVTFYRPPMETSRELHDYVSAISYFYRHSPNFASSLNPTHSTKHLS